jgi:hypothetical protein
MKMQPETCSTDMQYGQAATCSIPNAAWTAMQQIHKHTWTCITEMDIQQPHGYIASKWTCRRNIDIDIDMDMNMDNREKNNKFHTFI